MHRLDAAHLVALAVDDAPAGTIIHATAEEGVPARAIAEAIGRGLDVPVASVAARTPPSTSAGSARSSPPTRPASSAKTRALLGWEPTRPGLIEDLDAGHYFHAAQGLSSPLTPVRAY